jgi:predicted CXXCH cytochrome family protein
MAILYGDDSKMVATYPGKTYSGRFAHPFDAEGILGETEFGCVDCHDVHNTNANHVVGNKMENLAYACAGCHLVDTSLDPAALQARTQDFSERLLDTILAEMLTFADDTALDAALQTKIDELAAEVDPVVQKAILMAYIQERTVYFPNIAVAHAATSWKVFTYEDGAPQGQTHGHGGSWAHNSAFARQVMYDAIESLGGDLTGLTRP